MIATLAVEERGARTQRASHTRASVETRIRARVANLKEEKLKIIIIIKILVNKNFLLSCEAQVFPVHPEKPLLF